MQGELQPAMRSTPPIPPKEMLIMTSLDEKCLHEKNCKGKSFRGKVKKIAIKYGKEIEKNLIEMLLSRRAQSFIAGRSPPKGSFPVINNQISFDGGRYEEITDGMPFGKNTGAPVGLIRGNLPAGWLNRGKIPQMTEGVVPKGYYDGGRPISAIGGVIPSGWKAGREARISGGQIPEGYVDHSTLPRLGGGKADRLTIIGGNLPVDYVDESLLPFAVGKDEDDDEDEDEDEKKLSWKDIKESLNKAWKDRDKYKELIKKGYKKRKEALMKRLKKYGKKFKRIRKKMKGFTKTEKEKLRNDYSNAKFVLKKRILKPKGAIKKRISKAKRKIKKRNKKVKPKLKIKRGRRSLDDVIIFL